MALPSSGAISTDMIRTELKLAANTPIVIPDTVRKLAGKPTGSIIIPNDLWGKSDEILYTLVSKNYKDNYTDAFGYSKAWNLGSVSPNTINNALITRLTLSFEDRGGYIGIRLTTESALPFNSIRMTSKTGGEIFSVVLTGNATKTGYEVDLTDSGGQEVDGWFTTGGGTFTLEGI